MRKIDFNLVKDNISNLMKRKNISNGVALVFFVCESLFDLDLYQVETFLSD